MYPLAHGGVAGQGCIKNSPEDFRVTEELNFVPNAGGEHLWLLIEKRGWNTEDVAVWLAKAAGVHRLAVGYSGLKDKRAVTKQWFSIQLPGKPNPEFNWPDGVSCLSHSRHKRKLNRGTHRHNLFVINIRQLDVNHDLLQQRLNTISQLGVPNYFGSQRMGHFNNNLTRATAWLGGVGEAPRKRAIRGFWLSAMRSHLFNRVLAERVRLGVWDHWLEGDILQPDGRRGLFFAADEPCAVQRLAALDAHPTAPLPGFDPMQPTAQTLRLEQRVLLAYADQVDGLKQKKVKAARRATRLPVKNMTWQQQDDVLELRFRLPAGAYATTVLAELIREGADVA